MKWDQADQKNSLRRGAVRNTASAYGLAVAAVAAAVLLRWLLDPLMGNSFPLVTLFGAVAVAVWLGGYRPALVVVVLGYLACNYLFIEPRHQLGLDRTQNLIGFIAYLFTCFIIIGFGEAMRVSQRRFEELVRQREESPPSPSIDIESIRLKHNLTNVAGIGFGLTLAVLIIGGVAGYVSSERLVKNGEMVDHTHIVIGELDNLLSALKDAETGQRGYLLRGDSNFLEPYNAALARIDDQLPHLNELISDNPSQQARLPALEQKVAAELNHLRQQVAQLQTGDRAGALNIIGLNAGKALMDDVRKDVAVMRAEEEKLLEQRAEESAASSRVTKLSIIIPAFVGLILVVAAFYLSQRNLRIRQRAAEVLAEQRERLRTTLASIGDAVISTDTAGRITSMNATAESLTGWKQEEAASQPLDTVFHIINEETRQPVHNPAMKAMKECVVVGLANHTVLIAKSGTELPIDDSAAPIRCARGEIVGCVLVFRDITQRRRAEQERADETARIESVVNHVIDGIIAIDENGTVGAFNPAAEKLFGYKVEEVLGQNVKMLMPEPFHGEHDAYLANYRRTGQAKVIGIGREVEGRRKDGSTFPMELAVSEFWLSQRRYFTGIVRDITERKQAEERLRRKDLHLESITENTSAMLSRCSRDLRYIFVNRAYAELVRKPRDEIQGRPIVEIMGHQGFEIIRPHVTRVLRGEMVEYESIVPFEGVGPRFLHVRYVPDRDAQGEVVGWFASVADITERKRADARIHDLVADLKAADLRKDEFLATLAHELRGPLAPLHSALEILRLANDDPDLLQHSRATMERQLGHLERLIDDLLDVSRITRDKIDLRRDYVELASVIHQSLEACRPLAEAAYHEISLTLPPQPIYLHADPVRLAQVFSNILNNACKYTEPGGRISLTAERQGSDAMIRIQDSGIGIPPDKLGSIFEMFAQTDRGSKRSQGGLGIGLWLVRRLVEMHGGSVEAWSDGVGHGSEFIVRLPVLIERPVTPLPKPAAEPPTLTPRRFLIVDDSKDAAMSLAMLLKMSGNETRIAYDGLQAVEAARQFHPDIVLLDIGLPKLNGYDACRRIREQPEGKDMVMVALTGWGQEEDRRKSHEAGFDYHIVKPVDYRALMSLLAEKLPTEVEKRAE